MDIAHSRLLKFLVKGDKSKMAEKHQLKIEVLTPTNIDSEVPRQQTLRAPQEDVQPEDTPMETDGPASLGNVSDKDKTQDEAKLQDVKPVTLGNLSDGRLLVREGDTVETYVPVLTVKTEESKFGKDGLRFQRVTVTEDVSVDFQHLFKKETKGGKTVVTQGEPIKWGDLRNLLNPVHVGEPMRIPAPPRLRRAPAVPQESGATEDKNSPDEKKVKTRIPVSRFKSAVAKVQRVRKDSEESREPKVKKEAPEKPPRRTSIPKLSDRLLAARNNTRKTVTTEPAVKRDKELVRVDEKDHPLARPGEKIPVKVDRIPPVKSDLNRQREDEDKNKTHEPEILEANENESVTDLNGATSTKETYSDQLDDEFDKLYEEIVDTEVESLPEEILNTKIKDPEKLDSKFEEIVHQYDEETIEQVKVEPVDKARYSKIPLLKRRSEHEIKVPKQYERRLSLKTGLKNIAITNAEQAANDEKITPSTPIGDGGTPNDVQAEPVDNTEDNTQTEVETIDNDPFIERQSPMPTPAYNIIATPDAELVRVGLPNFGISLERDLVTQNSDNTGHDMATPEPETVKVSVLGVSNETEALPVEVEETREFRVGYLVEEPVSMDAPQNIENDVLINKPEVIEISEVNLAVDDDVSNDKVEEDKIEELNVKDTVKVATIDSVHDDVSNDKVEEDKIEELDVKDTVKVATIDSVHDDVSNDKVEEDKIEEQDVKDTVKVATIDSVHDDVSNDKVEEDKIEELDVKDTVKVATIDFNIPVTNPDIKDPIPDTFSEFKSVNMLRGTIGIEERSKSRYVNKPIENKQENDINTALEEEIPIVKGKVRGILKKLTSQDDSNSDVIMNNKDDTQQSELKSDDVPLKGNVSKIINRITSQDVDHNVKKELDEMPKKKSVLSKIAMFERPAQEPIFPKKQPHKYSKPQRTISEEIRHSPKIVQEVLKPSIRNGQTDRPYEVITIDIEQPAEIVVNNEEQVLVVEELKEETVVFENLDNSKVEENTNNEPKEAAIIDEIATGDYKFNANEKIEFTPKELEIERESLKVTDEIIVAGDGLNVVNNYKSREAVKEYIPVKEKIKRLKSHDDSNLRKAKSTADLDIVEAVKGKVKDMIVRMNSMDFLDDRDDVLEEKEKISPKERPRKRSVSEKIAMFERKLTPVKMEDVKLDTGRALHIDPKPAKGTVDSVNSVGLPTKVHQPVDATPPPSVDTEPAPEQDYNDRIRELTTARTTHGSVTNMVYVPLSDGRMMPVLALGTALLDPRLAKHIVASAIDLGFRAIDTAFIYGTEKEVGEGIRAKIQDGTVKREDLFIMSKLWSTFHKPELVETACRASLATLGLEYFDLFMIHNPMSFKEGNDPLPKIANVIQFSSYEYLDAWFAMEGLVAKGLVRSLGLSNFNSEQVARVVEKGRLKPVVNQVECHPYLSQQRLSDFCEARDVRLSCFGTLGSPGTPAELKASQAAALRDPLVQVMAAGLGISPAQLLIRYQLECGHGVVVKASTAAHQWDVLQALAASLAPAQVAALQALNKNKRAFTFKGMGDTHRNYPFKIPF